MLYKATPAPTIVSVPRMNYLTIAGAGLPSDAAYQDALRDLHKMAHTIRMNIVRMEGYYDFVPPPLETIWSKGSSLGESDEDPWHWTCLIRVPDFVTVSALCNIMVYYKHFWMVI